MRPTKEIPSSITPRSALGARGPECSGASVRSSEFQSKVSSDGISKNWASLLPYAVLNSRPVAVGGDPSPWRPLLPAAPAVGLSGITPDNA
ncbi:unnamed protein product [Gadus morhua 'NCC']